MLALDHIAVAGETLDAAVAHVEDALGVALQAGGEHAHFATHNKLLGLADGLYLEAIATNPAATPKQSPRWFDLDRFQGAARLACWICRTDDLEAALAQMSVDAGQPVQLARGDLRWKMAVPSGGVLPFDNRFPALMQWQGDHPAARLTDRGCRLRRLVVSHPEAYALRDMLRDLLQLQEPTVVFEPGEGGLMAEIDTPQGLRILR